MNKLQIAFRNSRVFGDFDWPFWRNDQKCWHFFVIFHQDNIFFILVEFECDRMSPRESPKNGRIGAYGFKCQIFLNSELIFEIYHKNHLK